MKLNRQATIGELDIPGALYDELLHDFLAGAEAALEDLGAALKRSDLDEVSGIAHMLKGSAASLRLEEMRAIAQRLEAACRQARDKATAEKRVAELCNAVEEFRALLS